MDARLDHNSIVPLYTQIVNQIQADIDCGAFNQSARLPTETELSDQYRVSRITIRRAVDELVGQGLVEKKQGKGTFVCAPKPRKDFQSSSVSFSEMCAANGFTPRAKLLEAGLSIPDVAQIAQQLGIREGEQAVHIRRLRFADERPVALEDNYFPLEYAYLLSIDLENDSIYRYLRQEKGIDMRSTSLSLRIVRANAKMAGLLQVPRNTPQLQMTGVVTRLDGQVIHTSYQLGYGEDFEFVVR